MKENYVYYIGYNSKVYDQSNMKDAFYLMTGKTADSHWNEYIKFIDGCFGKSIKEYFNGTVENLIKLGYKFHAIKLYRETHEACSILEAKEAVESMIENIKNNT